MAEMKRVGRIVAALVFAFVLMMGALGAASVHAGAHSSSMNHHGVEHPPSPLAPTQGEPHKVALTLAAPCCPAAEAPAGHALTVSVRTVETSWHHQPDFVPNAQDIAPDTPPPKTRR